MVYGTDHILISIILPRALSIRPCALSMRAAQALEPRQIIFLGDARLRSCRKKYWQHRMAAIGGLGFWRFTHLTAFIKEKSRPLSSPFFRAMVLSMRPVGPTKGRLCLMSSLPGASPTNKIVAPLIISGGVHVLAL